MKIFSRGNAHRVQIFTTRVFPTFITYTAILLLVSKAYLQFSEQGKFLPILTLYLTAIAITAALASVTFAYARLKSDDERSFLISTGELFLYGAVSLIFSLLTAWLVSQAKSLVLARVPYPQTIDVILLLVFFGGQGYTYVAAGAINTGLVQLERALFEKLQNRNLHKLRPFHKLTPIAPSPTDNL